MSPASDLAPMNFLIPSSVGRPGDDPIFALHGQAVARAKSGESVLNATIGALMESDGSLATMPSVDEALAHVPLGQAASYAPIAGVPGFLESVISDLFGEREIAKNSVAVATPGGTGAVYAAIVNFLDEGQALLTTSYYWGPYRILSEHHGRRIETFEMFGDDGRLNLSAFETALSDLIERQGRALIVLNTPCHNPTGYSLDDREWAEVTRIVNRAASKAPVALLIDHAYAKFGAGTSDAWLGAIEQLSERALVMVAWTVSKAFAQYGARVGALIATCRDADQRIDVRNALSYTCRGTWSNCNHLGMLAITRLLQDPELRRRSIAERDHLIQLLNNRVELFNQLAADQDITYPRYEGGFFVSVFTPDAEVTVAHMREAGVFVVPLQGAVRLALCATPVSEVPRLVEAVVAGVRAAESQVAAR